MKHIAKDYALRCAKELTTVAMEHSMIPASENPEETAKDVARFMDTLYLELLDDEASN